MKTPVIILNSRKLVLNSVPSNGLIFSLTNYSINGANQSNHCILFIFCLLHTFPAVILYFFPVSARSYIVPDEEKYFCVYNWLHPKSVLSHFIGRFDGISPVKRRFVSKERVKLLSIRSFPVFIYETVTCSSSLVRLQFLVPRWGPGLSRQR